MRNENNEKSSSKIGVLFAQTSFTDDFDEVGWTTVKNLHFWANYRK